MCPACADKVLLCHFRAWAESDPWSHLSSGAKVSHNTSLWLFVLWRACRLLLPVSHAEEEGTSICNTPETEAGTMHRESIFYANERIKLCIPSLAEIIPLKVQLFLVLLLGGGSFAQLPPPCPGTYVALCESDVHLHKGSTTSEKLFEVFCLATTHMTFFFCKFPELNTD